MTASRAFPLAVLGGLAASLLFVAGTIVSVGGMILLWMSPLPLFVVGLRLGLRSFVIASLTGTAAISAGELALGPVFAELIAIPVLALVALALRIRGERVAGALVLGLTGLGMVGFGLACLVAADQDGGLQGAITAAMQDVAAQTAQQFPDVPAIPKELLEQAGLWVPGCVAALWMIVLAGNGLLAMGALQRFGGALLPAPPMASIALPRMVSIGFGAALLAARLGSDGTAFAGVNLAEILAVPLLFGGLGVVHAAVARQPARALMLTAFYAVIMGFGFTIVLVVALGVIEQWVGLRQRIAASPRQGEQ